jgi:hypothetical protein
MDPPEAARIRGQAAKTLAKALGRETDAGARSRMAEALSAVSGRMDPTEAARICGQAAKMLTEALGRETDAGARQSLTQALSGVSGRMDPTEAERISEIVIRLSVKRVVERAPAGGPWDDPTLVSGLLRYLDPTRSKTLTCEVIMGLGSKRNLNELHRSAMLDDILGTQELVDLLKMPTCFGEARRVVLDHLGNRYGRRFVNHWAFVRFAREQHLGLDFTTAPKRPDPKESLKRMLEALGETATEP